MSKGVKSEQQQQQRVNQHYTSSVCTKKSSATEVIIPNPNAVSLGYCSVSSSRYGFSASTSSTVTSTPESSRSSSVPSFNPSAMIRRSSKSDLRGGNKCTIRLLDDNEVLQCDFQTHHKGQFLMDYVCRQLNIAEKDYFGLRYVDSNKQRHWLDLGKSIIKQLKDNAYILCFRIKFYPNDPMLLKEEVSRYQLVLQLRRDLLHGRLYSTLSDMSALVSFILQSELGDYNPEAHPGNYVAEYELIARQSQELEEKAAELHQKLHGLTPSEADTLFLKKAATLDTYGIDPHPVKDQQGEQVFIGINHTGVSTFQGSRKSTHFKWTQITKLNYEAKMFIIHLSIPEDSRNKKKETVGFKCQNSSSCKFLWRCAVEQRLFFNCGSATDVPNSVRGGGIFGSRFKYHGRVQREILEDPGPLRASDAVINRTPLYKSFQRGKTRSVPHSPSHIGYGSLPRSNHSAPSEGMRLDTGVSTIGSSTSLPLSTLSSPYCPDHTLPILETLQEDSPRVEEKGQGESRLVRNGSIKSTISRASIDEPDLTFLASRNVQENLDYLEGDHLTSISEEAEDDGKSETKSTPNKSIEKGSSAKSGNGHLQQMLESLPHSSEKPKAFVPTSNAVDGDIFTEDKLRDSKIDHISSTLSSAKSQNNLIAIWKIFIVCFICVVMALVFVAIVAIELDVDVCVRMRRIPEVEYFQYEMYEPFKRFLKEKFQKIDAALN